MDDKNLTKFDVSSKKKIEKYDNDLLLTAIELYEKLLGKRFLEPKNKNIIDRIQKNLTNYLV